MKDKNSSKVTYLNVSGVIQKVSEKALQLSLNDDARLIWIPRSICMMGHRHYDEGDEVNLDVADWFVKREKI